jgi:ATP-dependent DNA helicase RecQ
LIQRGKRGYLLKSTEPPTDEALEALLHTYVERAQQDKERLADMMHYAETVACRVQTLRAYFGESEGDRCKRCDNCLSSASQPDNASRRQAAREELVSNGKLAVAVTPEIHQADQPHDGGNVTAIETIHGTILTTAPETLPQPVAELFAKGDHVRHKRFGEGRVKDALGDVALVHFKTAGDKKVKTSFLRAS